MSAPELGPLGTEEASVAAVVQWVHDSACVFFPTVIHDPLCNTMRLLAEDHAQLSRADMARRSRR